MVTQMMPNIELMTSTTTAIPDINTQEDDAKISMENLYPALIQCFAIIICGYLAGRLNIISSTEAKGLGTFVGNFALPSLIFLSLSKLQWNTVNWTFLISILAGKAIVFFSVVLIALLVIKPLNLAKAGLLAIFCTQSNDFAIGLPIVTGLYETSHPEYIQYIYLLAPISLAILNPIGYVFMEITKIKNKELEAQASFVPQCVNNQIQDSKQLSDQSRLRTTIKIIYSIFINPVLMMTVLGVLGGVFIPNGLPTAFSSILDSFGKAFSSAALFLLGLRMVGKAQTFQGGGYILPGILIIVKLLVLPVVMRQTVNLMDAGVNFTDTTNLSTFGFLYGTFPAAPGVFVIASQYNLEIDLVASSMVASTFISAPLMFMSAKMIAINDLNPSDYINEFDKFSLEISIVAAISCIFLFILFGCSRKFKRMPHKITCCLVLSQLVGCIGVILWSTLGQSSDWRVVLQFCFFTIGSYSSRLWTAILAITLLFLQCRSLCFVIKLWPAFVLVGWGVPTIITALLLIFNSNDGTQEKRNPSFQYGNVQAAISVFILVMCFIVIIGCLILQQRYKRVQERYQALSKEVANSESDDFMAASSSTADLISQSNNCIPVQNSRRCNLEADTDTSDDEAHKNVVRDNNCDISKGCCSNSSPIKVTVDIEDLVVRRSINNTIETSGNQTCPSQYNCSKAGSQNCASIVEEYVNHVPEDLEPIELETDVDSWQTLKHTVLLLLLLCSMFLDIALSIWTLVMEGMSGIYVEMTFLDAFLSFGQSLITLAVFIPDTGELYAIVVGVCRKIWYGATVLNLPKWDQLSTEAQSICEQFSRHHLDRCRREIARDKRWRVHVYKKVFRGNTFVDWLIEVGLARDRSEAIVYGRALVDGRVLHHINNVHHFQDKNYLYTFCGRV